MPDDSNEPPPLSQPTDTTGLSDSLMEELLRSGAVPRASRHWQPPTVEQLQTSLPQYEISAFVARGGMGAVYRGTQTALKRSVAIKVLPPDIEHDDLNFAKRFKQEAQAMAQLSHPGIVAVHDAGETAGGLLYFVMEFIEGSDIAQLIAQDGKLEPPRALSITSAVLDALAFAHEEGIVHRDIKPSNIMLDKRGRVKVADFGLAKTVNADSGGFTRSDLALGSADFIAPEALVPGVKLDARADLYAVGVMLYQMLTGRIPRGHFDPPSGVVEQLDPRLDAIVLKAMKTDRDKRYASAAEMKAAIDAVAQGSADTLARTHDSGGAAAKKKEAGGSARTPLIIAATALILIAAALFIWKKDKPPTSADASKPAGVSSSPSLSVSPASSSASTISWHDWLAETEAASIMPPQLAKEAGGWRIKETNGGSGAYARFNAHVGSSQLKDAAIRVTYVPLESDPGRQAFLSVRQDSDRRGWRVSYNIGESRWVLDTVKDRASTDLLALPPMPELLSASREPRTIELRMVGDTLSFYYNGTLLGSTHDATPATGQLGFSGPPGMLIQKVEWGDLSGLPEAEARKLAGTSPTPSPQVSAFSDIPQPKQWIDATAQVRGDALKQNKIKTDGEWFESISQTGFFGFGPKQATTDALVRVTFQGRIGITLRNSDQKIGYLASVGKNARLQISGNIWESLVPDLNFGQDYKMDEPHEAVFAVQGSQLRVWLDGRLIMSAADSRLPTGKMEVVMIADGKAPPSRVKKVEWGTLDSTPSSSPSPAVSPPTSASDLAPLPASIEARAVRVWDTSEKVHGDNNGVRWEHEAMRLDKRGMRVPGLSLRDIILRASLQANPDAAGIKLHLRKPLQGSGKATGYILEAKPAQQTLRLLSIVENEGSLLRSWQLPRTYTPDEWIKLEFRAIGDALTVIADGHLLGSVRDDTLSQPGGFELYAESKGYFRDISYIPLDGISEAEVLKIVGVSSSPGPSVALSSASAFPSGRWVKPWPDLAKLPDLAEIKDGWARMKAGKGDVHVPNPHGGYLSLRNGGIRARFQVSPNWPGMPILGLRNSTHSGSDKKRILELSYVAPTSTHKECFLALKEFRWELAPPNATEEQKWNAHVLLAKKDVPPVAREFTVELITVGRTLVARIDGETLTCTLPEESVRDGVLNVFGVDTKSFRDLEVINLDGLPEAEALKLAGVSSSPSPPVSASSTAVGTYGGHRYQFVPGAISWAEAKAKAQAMGGHLATLTSKEECAAVYDLCRKALPKEPPVPGQAARPHQAWLGAARAKDAGWEWITGEPFAFTDWNPFHSEDKHAAYGLTVMSVQQSGDDLRAWNGVLTTEREIPHIAGFIVEWDDD